MAENSWRHAGNFQIHWPKPFLSSARRQESVGLPPFLTFPIYRCRRPTNLTVTAIGGETKWGESGCENVWKWWGWLKKYDVGPQNAWVNFKLESLLEEKKDHIERWTSFSKVMTFFLALRKSVVFFLWVILLGYMHTYLSMYIYIYIWEARPTPILEPDGKLGQQTKFSRNFGYQKIFVF